jgi:DNA-binding MarR family transcriptional regulator/N-acetylglutamate synthase-like GNAT family acetyltransferase
MSTPRREQVDAVRAFNRFWTARLGLLDTGYLKTRFSVTEARVLFELAQGEVTETSDLRARLAIDAGYLSRILGHFRTKKLVVTQAADEDARRREVRLTAAGKSAFALLDARSAAEVRGVLAALGGEEQDRLVGAMEAVQRVLGGRPHAPGYVLRLPGPGDLGWVVERHGALYAEEYRWDATFEALVARVVADFVDQLDTTRDRAWIAELDGRRAGSILCVKKTAKIAQLRLLLVEPWARGRGIGARLVDECVRFARQAGYRELVLWTNDVLVDARRLYERAGFSLRSEKKHRAFGHDLVSQDWARALES